VHKCFLLNTGTVRMGYYRTIYKLFDHHWYWCNRKENLFTNANNKR